MLSNFWMKHCVRRERLGPSVNITIGLPFIRVSVDHGTAFDIAGENIASSMSTERAIEVALQVIKNRQEYAKKRSQSS